MRSNTHLLHGVPIGVVGLDGRLPVDGGEDALDGAAALAHVGETQHGLHEAHVPQQHGEEGPEDVLRVRVEG